MHMYFSAFINLGEGHISYVQKESSLHSKRKLKVNKYN